MSRLLCIYHGGCDDGFGAAWIVRRYFGESNVEFYPGSYAKAPPDVAGRDVLMVDFSYKRPVLERMIDQCNSMLILDHHKTAQEDLAFLPALPLTANIDYASPEKAEALFDMDRSGAGITSDFYFPEERRSEFVNYLEDRDLWRKQLPDGDEFTIALRSYPQDFAVWDGLFARGARSLIEEGRSIQRYYRLRIEELKRHAYPAQLGGHAIWITNAPYFAASEAAGELSDKSDAVFGACYFEVEGGKYQYSLRSRGDFDVSAVAKQFGGGGHRNAAGFTSLGHVHILRI